MLDSDPIFQNIFLSANIEEIPISESKNIAFFGLLFGDNWCPHCKNFIDFLRKEYSHVNNNNKEFEVLFESLDTNVKDFEANIRKMPWYHLPFQPNYLNQLKKCQMSMEYLQCLFMII